MTEILTESFCERCGTRYTFESARPRTRLKGVKVLSRGLKNFVLSDDTSIDEAMASARSEAEREASSHQLDAFHKTFNFCMSCRQYTCPNCWNEAVARCLSCAPLAIPEVSYDIHDLRELRHAVLIGEAEPTNGAPAMEFTAEAWPAEAALEGVEEVQTTEAQAEVVEDWPIAAQVADEAVGELAETPISTFEELAAAADEVVATEVVVAAEEDAAEAEVVVAADEDAAEAVVAADEVATEEVAADDMVAAEAGDSADKAASQTLGLLRRFRPGQSLDAELDAFERERRIPVDAEPASELVTPADDLAALQAERLAATSESEEPGAIDAEATLEVESPVVAAESFEAAMPELAVPVADEAPEPVAAQPVEAEPEAAPEQPAESPLAAAASSDVVQQPTWRITAPDPTAATPAAPGIDERGSVPLQASAPAHQAGGVPQWPARPEWPSTSAGAGLPFLGRPATPQGGIDALWAASNQELVTAPPAPGKAVSGIQPCISCGLSLSAVARFCRRCGMLQTR